MIRPRRRRACSAHRPFIPRLANGSLERLFPDRARRIREHLEICERCEFEHWVWVRSGAASKPYEEGSLSDSADSAAIREIVARKLAECRRKLLLKRLLGAALVVLSAALVVALWFR